MSSKPKRFRNKAILVALGRDDSVIERIELPLKQFKESSIPMLSSAKYRASKGIRYVSGDLWDAGADVTRISHHYSDTGKRFSAIGWDGAPPLLLPVSLLPQWMGNLMPLTDDSRCPDRQLPEGDFVFDGEFDFQNPKTDYDRLCALALQGGWVHRIRVGNGNGLSFSSDEPWIWWEPQKMLVGAGHIPSVAEVAEIAWTNELAWEAKEGRFVIMNSCTFGRELSEHKAGEDYFKIRLQPGKYTIQVGKSGKHGPYLFRFVLKRATPRESQ